MTQCKGMNCGTTTGDHSPECRAEHAAAVAGGRFVKDAGARDLSKLNWLDASIADPIEKARRVLKHLIKPDAVYFFEDGFPRCNTMASQAACVLAVLDALSVPTSALNAPCTAPSAASGQKLTDQAILNAWDAVQEPFGDAHIISFARAILAASEPKKD